MTDEEAPLPGYYCWIKLMPATEIPLEPEGTGKPPRRKAYVPDLLAQSAAKSVCFHVGTNAHKPGTDDVFEIGPAFSNYGKAVSWSRGAGKAWIDGAKDCVLVGLSYDIPKDDATVLAAADDDAGRSEVPARGGFPDEDWTPKLHKEFARRGQATVSVLGHEIELQDASTFAKGDECSAVLSLIGERSESRRLEIIKQALSDEDLIHHAVIEPLTAAGFTADAAAALDVATYAFALIRTPTYLLKANFNRARPWNCCGEALQPMFSKGRRLYPGHPSYPSGHSTQAHTLAFLFAMRYPDLRQTLLCTAGRIALNREIAGVHFPSDSAAGRWLGEQFANAIFDPKPEQRDDSWLAFKRALDSLGPR